MKNKIDRKDMTAEERKAYVDMKGKELRQKLADKRTMAVFKRLAKR